MNEPDDHFARLDPLAKGRINGLLEAADVLAAKAEYHDDLFEKGKNTTHHNAARNTANNLSKKLQKRAINVALEDKDG